jgi:hypothetical protein
MGDPLNPRQIQQAEQKTDKENFPHRVAVALDQDLNVDAGGLPDETISSRVRRISDAHPGWNPANWAAAPAPWRVGVLGVWFAKALNAGLNVVQTDHGQHAQVGDLERALKAAETERKALGIVCEDSSKPSKPPR